MTALRRQCPTGPTFDSCQRDTFALMLQPMKRKPAPDPLEFFGRLGMTVERKWRNRNYDDTAFPQIAEEALVKHSLVGRIDPWEIIRSLGGSHPLTSQQDVDGLFGNPPITLFTWVKILCGYLLLAGWNHNDTPTRICRCFPSSPRVKYPQPLHIYPPVDSQSSFCGGPTCAQEGSIA